MKDPKEIAEQKIRAQFIKLSFVPSGELRPKIELLEKEIVDLFAAAIQSRDEEREKERDALRKERDEFLKALRDIISLDHTASRFRWAIGECKEIALSALDPEVQPAGEET